MACGSQVAPNAAGVVVADGNSLTAPGAAGNWFAAVRDRLQPPPSLAWADVAVSGKTTAELIAAAPSRVDPLLIANPGRVRVVVLWEITNDLIYPDPGVSADTAIAHVVQYAADRRAAGWEVILASVLPRDVLPPYTTTRGEFEQRRQTVNAWLRANWRRIASGFVDVGADPRIGVYGAELDTTLYKDGTHLTPEGQQIVADLIEPAIRAAISPPHREQR